MKHRFGSLGLLSILFLLSAGGAGAKSASLPPSWDGVWKGKTTLVWANGKVEDVQMELEVKPIPAAAGRKYVQRGILRRQ